MSIAVILLVVGLIAGLARGGKLDNLAKLEFRYPLLVFLGLTIQVASEVFAGFVPPGWRDDGRGLAILLSSYILLIAFVVINRHLPGMLFVGIGLALNLLVITLNGGMPVSIRSAEEVGIDPGVYLERAIKHRPLGPGTLLPFLADVIPLPFIRNVVSVGDVVLGVGVFLLVERSVRYQPRRLRGTSGA